MRIQYNLSLRYANPVNPDKIFVQTSGYNAARSKCRKHQIFCYSKSLYVFTALNQLHKQVSHHEKSFF